MRTGLDIASYENLLVSVGEVALLRFIKYGPLGTSFYIVRFFTTPR